MTDTEIAEMLELHNDVRRADGADQFVLVSTQYDNRLEANQGWRWAEGFGDPDAPGRSTRFAQIRNVFGWGGR